VTIPTGLAEKMIFSPAIESAKIVTVALHGVVAPTTIDDDPHVTVVVVACVPTAVCT
jgi:hypothetical protein